MAQNKGFLDKLSQIWNEVDMCFLSGKFWISSFKTTNMCFFNLGCPEAVAFKKIYICILRHNGNKTSALIVIFPIENVDMPSSMNTCLKVANRLLQFLIKTVYILVQKHKQLTTMRIINGSTSQSVSILICSIFHCNFGLISQSMFIEFPNYFHFLP